MMRSMYAGVSGLKVHQTKMDVVGNNISNVNTTGYKGSRATFKSMMSQLMSASKAPQEGRGGVNPQQVGLGVSIGSIDTNMQQGNLQSTGMGTDLAIQGNGFFVANDGQQDFYTRAGALSLDENGNLTNSSNGYIMKGWMADDSGNINTNESMEGIQIPVGQSMPGEQTTEASFGGNLDGRALGGDTKKATIDVFDSLGEKHTMSVNFERQLDGAPSGKISPDSWNLTAEANSANKDVNGLNIEFGEDTDSALNVTYESSSHTVTVTGDWDDSGGSVPGSLGAIETEINSVLTSEGLTDISLNTPGTFNAADLDGASTLTLESAANSWEWSVSDVTGADVTSIKGDGTISFNDDGTYDSMTTNTAADFTPIGSASMDEMDLNLQSLTQSSADYSIDGTNADGFAMGSLESFTINSAGIINGTFSNGLTQKLGQLGIANFSNPSGLKREGDTLFQESQNSGMAQVGTAGNGGRGEISAGTLEMSNVDLSKQFTEMITTQRGFQANSKTITTTDQMLQELVNLKR